MVTIRCDGCGVELKRGTLRYTVRIDVRAAYDELEVRLIDLVRNHRDEMLRLIEQMKLAPADEAAPVYVPRKTP